MHQLYLLVNETAVGPFTGVEMREAALAGIVRFSDIIGAGPEGPWYRAADIGLFDVADRSVLPHPQGTVVPSYFLRGVAGARDGAYQLRELLPLAAKGRLSETAEIRTGESPEWFPVQELPILNACLANWLVVHDQPTGDANDPAVSPDAERSGVTQTGVGVASADHHGYPQATGTEPQDIVSGRTFSLAKPSKWRSLTRAVGRHRTVFGAAVVMLALFGLGFAAWQWSGPSVSKDQLLGQWVAYQAVGDDDVAYLGIRFTQTGEFVVCNSAGPSWTGSYELTDCQIDPAGVETEEVIASVIDSPSLNHERGVVSKNDVHIRLSGFVKDPPNLAGHAVRDFFVRLDDKNLMVGYPIAIRADQNGSSTEVAWIRLMRKEVADAGPINDLSALDPEGKPESESRGYRPLPISDAIATAEEGFTESLGGKSVTLRQSPAYSKLVTVAWLLNRYGTPDEARPLHAYEIPALDDDEVEVVQGAQLIRYRELKLVFNSDGTLVYLGIGSKGWTPNQR